MKKMTIGLATALCAVLVALPASAQQSASCSWEDGVSTILGFFGNLANPTNVGSPEPVNSGLRSLRVTESPEGGTPQAYIAYIENLTDGDVIDACFYGYDTTPGASPSLRIWGHYAQSGDVTSFAGSAGGNNTFTDGNGWDQVCHQWVFDSDLNTRDALVVEARLYSPTAEEPDFYIDDVSVQVSSSSAIITLACGEDPVSVESDTWGNVKALYR